MLSRNKVLASNHNDRETTDFYATSEEAVEYLLQYERFHNRIIEPACGIGSISETLIKFGYQVSSFDLVDRGYGLGGLDFLTSDFYDIVKGQADIITNCPYNLTIQFVARALEITRRKVAILFPVEYIGKFNWCRSLKYIYVFARRIDIAKSGDFDLYRNGNMKNYAWFVFDITYNGDPIVKTIKNIKTESSLIRELRHKYLNNNFYDVNEIEIGQILSDLTREEINKLIYNLNKKGLSNRHIARILKISEGKVRYQLKINN